MKARCPISEICSRLTRPGAPLLLGVALLLGAGCSSTPPDKMTLTEQVQLYSNVLKKLGSSIEEERTEAVNRFLAAGKERGSAVVKYFLEDRTGVQSERLRVNLAGILAQWKDPDAIPYLIEHFHTEDKWVRSIVDQSLLIYGNRLQVVEFLGEQLTSSSSVSTRRLAASILSRIQTPRAAGYLARRLRDPDLEVRLECVIGIIRSPERRERLGYLIDALTDPDSGIRELAWAAIVKSLEGRELPVEFEPYNPDEAERATAVAALRRWAGFSKVNREKTRT